MSLEGGDIPVIADQRPFKPPESFLNEYLKSISRTVESNLGMLDLKFRCNTRTLWVHKPVFWKNTTTTKETFDRLHRGRILDEEEYTMSPWVVDSWPSIDVSDYDWKDVDAVLYMLYKYEKPEVRTSWFGFQENPLDFSRLKEIAKELQLKCLLPLIESFIDHQEVSSTTRSSIEAGGPSSVDFSNDTEKPEGMLLERSLASPSPLQNIIAANKIVDENAVAETDCNPTAQTPDKTKEQELVAGEEQKEGENTAVNKQQDKEENSLVTSEETIQDTEEAVNQETDERASQPQDDVKNHLESLSVPVDESKSETDDEIERMEVSVPVDHGLPEESVPVKEEKEGEVLVSVQLTKPQNEGEVDIIVLDDSDEDKKVIKDRIYRTHSRLRKLYLKQLTERFAAAEQRGFQGSDLIKQSYERLKKMVKELKNDEPSSPLTMDFLEEIEKEMQNDYPMPKTPVKKNPNSETGSTPGPSKPAEDTKNNKREIFEFADEDPPSASKKTKVDDAPKNQEASVKKKPGPLSRTRSSLPPVVQDNTKMAGIKVPPPSSRESSLSPDSSSALSSKRVTRGSIKAIEEVSSSSPLKKKTPSKDCETSSGSRGRDEDNKGSSSRGSEVPPSSGPPRLPPLLLPFSRLQVANCRHCRLQFEDSVLQGHEEECQGTSQGNIEEGQATSPLKCQFSRRCARLIFNSEDELQKHMLSYH